MDENNIKHRDLTILVVEDSSTQAVAIRFFLEDVGYTTIMKTDGQKAFEWLKSTEKYPDIIISDIEMPQMNGYELCTAIRTDEKLKEIPVILLTGLSEPLNIIKSIESGADKFLVKPFDTMRLSKVIEELYINTQRRLDREPDKGIPLLFRGNDFLITAEKAKILGLLISSYEDSYYKNLQLEESRSQLESLNGALEEKVQERTKELSIQEKKFRTLAENTPDLIVRMDRDLNFVYMNQPVKNLFKISDEKLIGQPISLLTDKTINCSCSDLIKKLFSNGKEIRKEIEVQTPTGNIWLDSRFVAEYDDEGHIQYVLKVSTNITKRKNAERELLKLSQAVEQSPNTIVITDLDGNIVYVNDAFTRISGYTRAEAIGKNPRLLQSGKTVQTSYDDMWAQLTQGQNWSGEFINKRKDGTVYIEGVKASPIFQDDGEISYYMAIKEDITEQKKAHERIKYLANFDVLTGLPNRTQLEDHIKYAISLAKRHDNTLGILFLDLDNFKDINDTLGHRIGDLLLIELAKRFKSILREEDTVSRLSGDEFIFMVSNTDVQGVTYVAQKILDTMSASFILEKDELTVTASIGIALYPNDGRNQETLSKNADAAMYHAKRDGGNTYCFFTESMQESSSRNLKLTNALRKALQRDELHLVYQPQISADGRHIIGAEALLRWTHPEFGTVSPAEFIPLSEESGSILPIGEWVLRTAVKEAKRWTEYGLSPMVIAVNLSAVQFRHPRLPELITDILEETGLAPEYLEIELTEAVTMNDPTKAISVMNKLHECGIRMSIDDFGTGYSSLTYLKKFKVYKLKIDQSFICDIHTDPEDKAIVHAVINMAYSLGMKTIAEGVETAEQLNYLREQGCDEIQGYYYSKPLLTEDFEAFVRGYDS